MVISSLIKHPFGTAFLPVSESCWLYTG